MKTIVGLFDHFSDAEAVVRELERSGFDRSTVSMVASESARSASRTTAAGGDGAETAAEGAGSGAVIGGVAGGAAGLVARLAGRAVPGIATDSIAGAVGDAMTVVVR